MNYEQPEDSSDLTISAYDAREQEFRIETERRRNDQLAKAEERHHQRNLARLRLMGTAVVCTAMALTVVGVAYVIWLALRGPSAEDVQQQEARLECVDQGGVWLSGAEDSRNAADASFGACAFSRSER